MRKFIKFIPVILSVVIIMSSCDAIVDAKKVSDEFMEAWKTKNYETAVTLVGEDGLAATSKEGWIQAFETNFENHGEMKDYSSGNIKASTNDGATTTKVHYTVNYEDETLYVLVTLIKKSEEGPFKVLGFRQEQTESSLDFDF
ncbi:MAG: hypothetical protein J7L46_03085 [Bacteroidales bacterium]|nr:hypothetical protein [Bacteroidales bacterium]